MFCTYISLIILCCVQLTRGQDPNIDILTVPLKIGDGKYEIAFPADAEAAKVMALKFCKEKGESFNIDENNMASDCLGPVSAFLIENVRKYNEGQKASYITASKSSNARADTNSLVKTNGDNYHVSMMIQGNTYEFVVGTNSELSIPAVAHKFCEEHSVEFEINSENMKSICTQPIEMELQAAVQKQQRATVDSTDPKAAFKERMAQKKKLFKV